MPSRQFQHQVPQIWAIQSITCHERLQNLNGGEHLLPNKNRLVNNKMNININQKKIRNRENVPVLTPNVLAQSVLTSNVLAQSVLTSNVLAQAVLTSNVLAQSVLTSNVLAQAVLTSNVLAQSVLTSNVLAQAVLASNVLAQSVLTSNVLAPSVLTSSLLAHEAGVLCGLLSKTTVFETCNCF